MLTDRLQAVAPACLCNGRARRGLSLSASADPITVELAIDPAITAQLRTPPEHNSAGGSTDLT